VHVHVLRAGPVIDSPRPSPPTTRSARTSTGYTPFVGTARIEIEHDRAAVQRVVYVRALGGPVNIGVIHHDLRELSS